MPDAASTPLAARVAAVTSLISWTGVVYAGRRLAYLMQALRRSVWRLADRIALSARIDASDR